MTLFVRLIEQEGGSTNALTWMVMSAALTLVEQKSVISQSAIFYS